MSTPNEKQPVHPSAGADSAVDPQVAQDLRYEREIAEHQVGALTGDLADIVEAAELVATDDEHDPEGHTIAWERQQLAALVRAAEETLDELDAALARVERGTYGTCTTCGGSVGSERLAALPAAATCITCAP